MSAEDVIQCGDADTIRMTALGGLIELLGISQQNDCLSRLRYCENVSERHLRGFVDK